jgi:2-hydroxychromene-2-carboxylate isomerase
MSEDTARWARQYGVPMHIPKVFPVNSIRALRACVAADQQGQGETAMQALFRTYWGDGNDISDAKVIETALNGAGLDGKALVARTDAQDVKDALRQNTDLALSRGVFGVPTIFVGERSFWGNDRLHFVEAELKRVVG